jgi:hypothetical protein
MATQATDSILKTYALTSDSMGGYVVYGSSLAECKIKLTSKLSRQGFTKYDVKEIQKSAQFWGIPRDCYCSWVGDGWQWDFEEPQLLPV